MSDVFNWLRLIRSENVNNFVFWKLLQRYSSAAAAIEALPYLNRMNVRNKSIKIASKELIETELDEATKYGVKYICTNNNAYSPTLKHMPYPPPVISILGNERLLQKPSVALVGSRKASNNGMQLAAIFAKQLGNAGFAIVSGFANGIDTAAHKASVETGTIAIMAGGVNYIYPAGNNRLYYEIIDNDGVILSTKPFNYTPNSKDFPKRNKIIAGLCLAMLVVESTLRSGSLISARLANEYNKYVFALPQSLLNEQAQGNNELLRQGAAIALSPNDIIETILPISSLKTEKQQLTLFSEIPSQNYNISEPDVIINLEPLTYNKTTDLNIKTIEVNDDVRELVINNLNYIPTSIETIKILTKLSQEEIENVLVELQLQGKIKYYSNNNIALKF